MGNTESPAAGAPLPGLDAPTVERWIAGVAAARGRREPPASFPRLPDLPAGRYADAEFFALDEDIDFVAPIQASLTSPGFKGVPLNYQERRIYHWHEELNRRIGVDRVPPHLRVAPILAEWLKGPG